MTQFRLMAVVFSAATVFAFGQFADASCGSIEVAKGDVKIVSSGKTNPAAVGAKICSGDAIIAGADSRAKLKMEDGNELNVMPSSQIVLETYQFNPAENKKKVLLNVLMGKVRATTKEENMYNDTAKDGQANTFQVKTKSAVAGVRGTDFLTGYDPATKKSDVVTFRGKVDVGQAGPGGTIMNAVHVTAGQRSETGAGGKMSAPKAVPPGEMKKMNSDSKADTASSSSSSPSGDKKSDKKDSSSSGDKQSSSSGDKHSSMVGGETLQNTQGNDTGVRDPASTSANGGSNDSGSPKPPPPPPPPPNNNGCCTTMPSTPAPPPTPPPMPPTPPPSVKVIVPIKINR